MRFLLLLIVFSTVFQCFSQKPVKLLKSGIVMNTDSVPVPNVAIINISSGKAVRTNLNGFFLTEITEGDSLLVYHIAYKYKFINAKYNRSHIVLEPEIQELMQIDISGNKGREQKTLDLILDDIRRLAPMKKLSGYELTSAQEYFVNENGSHIKGFSPFFGPIIPIPLVKLEAKISALSERRQLEKMTSHYHIQPKTKAKR